MSQRDAESFLAFVQSGAVPLRTVCEDARSHVRDCESGPAHCQACVYAVALFHVLERAGENARMNAPRARHSKN